jgi:NAD(P)H-flavin reductase
VCSVGSCYRADSEAVLLDLEELCSLAADGCASLMPEVRPGGCLGYCSQAPNALLVRCGDGDDDDVEYIFTRLSTRRATAELALVAAGAVAPPDVDDEASDDDASEAAVQTREHRRAAAERLLQHASSVTELPPRVARARQLRAIAAATAEQRWNSAARLALEACGGDAAAAGSMAEDVERYCRLLFSAGAYAAAHVVLAAQLSRAPPAPSRLRVWAASGAAQSLAQLGAGGNALALLSSEQAALRAVARQPTAETEPLLHLLSDARRRVNSFAGVATARGGALPPPPVPDGYERWQVLAVEPVSAWSFTLTAKAPPFSSGTMKSSRRRRVGTSLWHVLALGELAARPTEGPLPLLEREYTPISSAEDWADGHVTLLVRLYPGAAVTPWLARLAAELPKTRAGAGTLLLGSPMATVLNDDPAAVASAAAPGPLIIACGGTGITVALQLLACAQHAWSRQPCSVIYSCRADDVLLLPQLETAAAARGAATRIRVHCTPAVQADQPPFAVPPNDSLSTPPGALPHCSRHAGRVCAQAVSEELAWLQRAAAGRHAGDVWALICGPPGFVRTLQAVLPDTGVPRARITTLAG